MNGDEMVEEYFYGTRNKGKGRSEKLRVFKQEGNDEQRRSRKHFKRIFIVFFNLLNQKKRKDIQRRKEARVRK